MLTTYFGKYYDVIGTLLGFSVLPFKFHFLTDINLVDLNAAINTTSALLSLFASAAGVILTCAKVAEKLNNKKVK